MRYLTAGESHGKKLTVILDDVPAGIKISTDDVEYELSRRGKFFGRSQRQDMETNQVILTGGISVGRTTGAPVSMEIVNVCQDDGSEQRDVFDVVDSNGSADATDSADGVGNINGGSNTDNTLNIPRPGHADLVGVLKYGMDDCVNVAERASARETAARCAASTVAKEFLGQIGVNIYACVTSIGSAKAALKNSYLPDDLPPQAQIGLSELLCADIDAEVKMKEQIIRAQHEGDTLGGTFMVIAEGLVPGLGGYSQGETRITSALSAAVMSVPAVKGLEFGGGFFSSENVGSAVNDQIELDNASGQFYRRTNFAGGVEGGMTNGMPLVIRCAMKPLPSVKRGMRSVDLDTLDPVMFSAKNRSDVCAVPSCAIAVESEVAFVLASAYQKKFGGDTVADIKEAIRAYTQRVKQMGL